VDLDSWMDCAVDYFFNSIMTRSPTRFSSKFYFYLLPFLFRYFDKQGGGPWWGLRELSFLSFVIFVFFRPLNGSVFSAIVLWNFIFCSLSSKSTPYLFFSIFQATASSGRLRCNRFLDVLRFPVNFESETLSPHQCWRSCSLSP